MKLSPDVSEALSNGEAVVALESTIISHGILKLALSFLLLLFPSTFASNVAGIWCSLRTIIFVVTRSCILSFSAFVNPS